jgi:predicted aspartyl protease
MAWPGVACSNHRVRSLSLSALSALLVWALPHCSTFAAVGTEPPPAVPVAPAGADQIDEVVVQATEPHFAAPTLRDRIGRIWAPVMINGKGPFRLVLDTGANSSAIIPRVAERLGSPPHSTVIVRGFTGSAIVPVIRAESMEVGELLLRPARLPVVADVFGGAEGVLGKEGLQDKRIVIDFGKDRIRIARSHRERAEAGFSVIPLKITRAGLLSARVTIGRIRANAIIDTGGQRSVGNLALQQALMRRAPKDVTMEEIVGVTLEAQTGQNIATPPIALGSFQVRGARITFADMHLFEHWNLTREPTLMIGMDVLGLLDVLIIDYRRRELQVRPRA